MDDDQVEQTLENVTAADVAALPAPGKINRVSDLLVPMVTSALERLADGEEIWWDFSFLPDPNTQGSVLIATFWMNSGVIGTFYNHVSFWSPMGHVQDRVDGSVREVLESLRAARSQSLAQHAASEAADGLPVPNGLSGLILPPTP